MKGKEVIHCKAHLMCRQNDFNIVPVSSKAMKKANAMLSANNKGVRGKRFTIKVIASQCDHCYLFFALPLLLILCKHLFIFNSKISR